MADDDNSLKQILRDIPGTFREQKERYDSAVIGVAATSLWCGLDLFTLAYELIVDRVAKPKAHRPATTSQRTDAKKLDV